MDHSLLRGFDIDPERGFLPPDDPLVSLPDELSFIDEYARELPVWIRRGVVREKLSTLPKLTDRQYLTITRSGVKGAAFRSYSFFASAYVLPRQGEPSTELIETIALPLYVLGRVLNVPPILQYYYYALYN